MRIKKMFCLLLALAVSFGCLTVNAGAAEVETQFHTLVVEAQFYSLAIERASGRFSMDIGKQSTVAADMSFPLEIGESVTINASYSPRSASVEFGLIAPDGLFYSLSGKNGSFNEAFKVDQRGNYTLAVQNNSNFTVSVSGFVNY